MRAKGEQGEEFQLPTWSFTTWFQPSGAKSQVRPTSSSSQEGESIFQGDDYRARPKRTRARALIIAPSRRPVAS